MRSRKLPLPLAAPPQRLCILRLSAIGDCCHVVPVVRTLQRHWPQTDLTWIIGRAEAALLADIPGVEFVVVDKREGWRARRSLARALGGRRFDVLLQMQAALRASWLATAVDAELRLGFDRARARDFQWLFTDAAIAPRPGQHVLDGLFGFLEALGIHGRELRWDIPIPQTARQRVAEWLPAHRPVLVMNPCSSARRLNYRNWPATRYAAVANWAAERFGMRVVLTGGRSGQERAYAEAIAGEMREPPVDLVGRTSLKELLAVLERAAALIAPDTGPVHMATAVGTPVVGLYATSNPARTGPYLSRQWVVDRYPDAARTAFDKPVEAIGWGRRVRDPKAMELITVADVAERLTALMTSTTRG